MRESRDRAARRLRERPAGDDPRPHLQRRRAVRAGEGATVQPGVDRSSPTNRRSRRTATTSCAGYSTIRSSSPAMRRATCGRCSTCACTAECRCVARRWATPPTSAAPTTAGPIATTAGSPGLPFHRDAYGGDEGFPKAGQTLLPAPNFASYNGLLFISLDPAAEPLRGLPRRLQVLSGLLHQTEHRWPGTAGTAALADQGELEDRRRELRRRHVPHAAHPRIDRRDRPVPRAEGPKAQGRRHLLGAPRGRNHLQASAGQLRRADALRRLSRRDDRPDQNGLDAAATADGRRGRIHDLGCDLLSEPEFRAQLAQGA